MCVCVCVLRYVVTLIFNTVMTSLVRTKPATVLLVRGNSELRTHVK
jgi:hypothetical protein